MSGPGVGTRLRRIAIRQGTNGVLQLSALISRPHWLAPAAESILTGAGDLAARLRGVKRATNAQELGTAWQSGFASTKEVPLRDVQESVATAEILTPCPLRGSGDLSACHRMMTYDRAFVKHAGGTLEVTRSQTQPGVLTCEVVLRLWESPIADSTPSAPNG